MSVVAGLRLEGLDTFARCEHAAMATTFVFYLRSPDLDLGGLRAAADEAFRLIDRLEDRLSFYREGSDVSRINRASPGETLRIADETMSCLLTAMEVAAASGGAFDPFAGALSLAAKGQSPPPHLIAQPHDDTSAAPCLAVDPESLHVTKLEGRRWLDLGAVGKGQALDSARAVLEEWGVTSGLLVAGGSSILAFGEGPAEGQMWPLTLANADGERSLRLSAPFALGASGEGFQPGHIVQTRTTARTPSPRRTYALAETAALADALSTALFVVNESERAALAAPWPTAAFLVEPAQPGASAEAIGAFAEQPPAAPACLLVVPCWCESRRLPHFLPSLCEALAQSGRSVEILPSDDGSPRDEADATAELVERLRRRYPHLRPLTRLQPHGGKGAAILHGWKQAAPSTVWLGFVDADGSVPATDVARLVGLAIDRGAADAVIAPSRRHDQAAHPVSRRQRRAWIGGLFARWAQWRLRHGADDPQCGCKIVPASLVRGRTWTQWGYGLDLELLLAAQSSGVEVVNPPIAWHETPASRLRVKDFFSMLQTVERLRITSRASSGPRPARSP